MIDQITLFLTRHQKLLFYSSITLIITATVLMTPPQFNGSLNGFDLRNNPLQQTALTIDSAFGDRNRIYVRITPNPVTSQEVFSGLRSLEDSLLRHLPQTRVFSLRHFYNRTLQKDKSDSSIYSFLVKASQVELFSDLISHDKKSFLLIVNLPNQLDLDIHIINSQLQHAYQGIDKIEALSLYHIQDSIEEHIKKDLVVISLAVIVFFLLFYWYLYRSAGAILFTVINITAVIMATIVLFSVFNVDLNIVTILAIPVVLVLSVSDAIHLITGIASQKSDSTAQGVRTTLATYFIPSLYSSLTTASAFFTFYLFNDSAYIREFGLICGVALLFEFLLTFAIAPFLLQRITVHKVYGYSIDWMNTFLKKKRQLISWIFLLLLGSSYFFVSRLHFNTSTEIFFSLNSELSRIHHQMNENFYSQLKLDLVIERKDTTLTSDDDSKRFVKELCEKIKLLPAVSRVTSATETIEIPGVFPASISIRQIFGNKNPFFNEDRGLHRVEVSFHHGDAIKPFYENDFPALEAPGQDTFEIKATSPALIMDFVNESVSSSLMTSLLTSCTSILLLIFLLTRSISLTILSILPNLVPLAALAIVFVLFDLDVNILTAITAVVCIGILDDDTIHILYRKLWLKRELEEVSFSIFSTSTLLAFGFGFFTLSSFEPTRVFGMVCASVFVIGVISDLTLMPWFIDSWEKFRGKKR